MFIIPAVPKDTEQIDTTNSTKNDKTAGQESKLMYIQRKVVHPQNIFKHKM